VSVFSGSYENFDPFFQIIRNTTLKGNGMKKAKGFFVLFFALIFALMPLPLCADTFFGEFKTGLIEIQDFKYPVFFYVPESVKPGSRYPLIISIPDEGEKPSENVQKWVKIADSMSLLVLVPTYKRLDELPNAFDRWFFQVKEMTSSAYPVNPGKIYLVGEHGGAAYAAYLGVNYPDEFSAIGILEGPLGGQFEKLMKLQTRPAEQIPIYIAWKEGDPDKLRQVEERALEFQENGYFVEFKKFPDDTDFSKRGFKKEMLRWMSDKSADWESVVSQSKKTFKEKFRKGVKEFFTI